MSATAFVPGHATGFFSPVHDDDPTNSGARGAGITLSDGISVTVASGDGVFFDGDEVEIEAVDRVLGALRVDARVTAETELPIGCGFGVSGGVALGTALAANEAFDRGLSVNELVTIAHGADVQAGTGLGDAVAQARGGVPIRLEPGGPNEGHLDGISAMSSVEYVAFGPVRTATVLAEETAHLTDVGRACLSMLVAEPTLPTLMRASRRFAREAGMVTPSAREAIEAVSDAGGSAAPVSIGNAVVAIDGGLTDAGYDANQCTISRAGAHLR